MQVDFGWANGASMSHMIKASVKRVTAAPLSYEHGGHLVKFSFTANYPNSHGELHMGIGVSKLNAVHSPISLLQIQTSDISLLLHCRLPSSNSGL